MPDALDHLAGYAPRTLATMHGTSFEGDGAAALRGLAGAWRCPSLSAHPGMLATAGWLGG